MLLQLQRGAQSVVGFAGGLDDFGPGFRSGRRLGRQDEQGGEAEGEQYLMAERKFLKGFHTTASRLRRRGAVVNPSEAQTEIACRAITGQAFPR